MPLVIALLLTLSLGLSSALAADFNNVTFHCWYDGDTCTFTIPAAHPLFGEKISVRIAQVDIVDLRGTLTKLKHKVKDAGDKVVIKLVVSNQGAMTPELPVVVALWLSDDQALDDGDTLLAQTTIGNDVLVPDESVSVKLKETTSAAISGMFAIVTIGENNGQSDQLVEEIGRSGCSKHTLLIEQEPNNETSESQKLGKIQPGTCYTIRGEIFNTQEGFDLDGFRLLPQRDQTIEATLTHSDDNDFDLGFFDPEMLEFVKLCEDSLPPEVCLLTVSDLIEPLPLDLVILPFEGTGSYTLDIMAIP